MEKDFNVNGGDVCTICEGTGICKNKKVDRTTGWTHKYQCRSCYPGNEYYNTYLTSSAGYAWCGRCGKTSSSWGCSVHWGCSHNRYAGGNSTDVPFVKELPDHTCERCKGRGATTKCVHEKYKPHELCSHNKTAKHD